MKYRVADPAATALVDGALGARGWTATSGDDWNLWWGQTTPQGGAAAGPRLVSHLAGGGWLNDPARMHRLLSTVQATAGPETPAVLSPRLDMPVARTFRVYVLISALDPLVVHIYRDREITAEIAERWHQVRYLAATTILAARDALLADQRKVTNCIGFAIVGMEIVFDERDAARLLACNVPPAFATEPIGNDADDERRLKLAVVSDAVQLVLALAQAEPAPVAVARTIRESSGHFELLVPSDAALAAGNAWLPRLADRALFAALSIGPLGQRSVLWPEDAVIYRDGAVAFSEPQQSFVALNEAATFAALSFAGGTPIDEVIAQVAGHTGAARDDAAAAVEDALAVLWSSARPTPPQEECPSRVPDEPRLTSGLAEDVCLGHSRVRIVFENATLRDAAAVIVDALGTDTGEADFEVDVCCAGTGALVRSGRECCAVADLRALPALLHASLLRRAYWAPGVALAVHAAAVAGPRGAILIAGVSGSGKTTLAAALVGKGLALVADEAGILDRAWNIEPAATWLALRTPALHLLGSALAAGSFRTCLRADGSTAHLFIPERRIRTRMPVAALVFPRIVDGADSELVPLGVPATVIKLAEAGIEIPNRLSSPDAYALLAGLAALPRFEARMGTIDSVAELVIQCAL